MRTSLTGYHASGCNIIRSFADRDPHGDCHKTLIYFQNFTVESIHAAVNRSGLMRATISLSGKQVPARLHSIALA